MIDVEIVERPGTLVALTENAAAKIKQLMQDEPEGEATVLRVAVQGGGCSGFEYALGFDSGAQEGDHEFELQGVTVVVDPFSAPYLSGAEIDYLETIQESGFKINNPNVVSACGCGHSFQVEEGAAPDAASQPGYGGCGSGCSH
jgi:iron-sulfur cluster assembly protein